MHILTEDSGREEFLERLSSWQNFPRSDKMRKALIIFVLIVLAALISAAYHFTQQPNINYYQGHRLFVEGQYRLAAPFFEKTLELSPYREEATLELGYSYLWTGNPQKAIPLLFKSVKNYSKDDKILLALSDAYSWNKQYDKAITILRGKILETGDVLLKKKLAELYLWSGDPETARNILEPVLKRYPNDPDALYLMGKALYYSGDGLKASEVLEKLLEGMNDK